MKFQSIKLSITSITTDHEIRNHLIRSLSPFIFSPENNMFDEFSDAVIFDDRHRPLSGGNLLKQREMKQLDAIYALFDELIESYNLVCAGISKETMSAIATAMTDNDAPGAYHRGGFLAPPGYEILAYRFLRWENNPYVSNLGRKMLQKLPASDKRMMVALAHIQELVGSYVEEQSANL